MQKTVNSTRPLIRKRLAVACLFLFGSFGQNLAGGQPAMAQSNDLKQSLSTDFALRLFKNEAIDLNKNVVVSPFSAYEALSMVANGAAGQTKAQIVQMLGVKGDDLKRFNDRNHAVMQSLNKNTAVRMEVANALYSDTKVPFKPTFTDLCLRVYNAEAHSENFADPGTVIKINSWCDQKTHGKIKTILDRLSPDDKLVLLNSVYFKGLWLLPFKPDSTLPRDFKLLGGGTKQVPMMYQKNEFKYLNGPGFQAVALPYLGGKQVMYVFLPTGGSDYPKFVASFTPDNWQKWMNGFEIQNVQITMPKYKVAFENKLNTTLKKMGMTDAFGGGANFSEMCNLPVNISRVLQKTFIEVDEKGTEAAAVTAVEGECDALHAEPKIVADHPFVVALTDRDTNEILFLGSIVDPTLK